MQKIAYLVVSLDRDITEEEFDTLSIAICSMRRVVKVEGRVSNMDTWALEQRVRTHILNQVIQVLVGGSPKEIEGGEVSNGMVSLPNDS